MFFIIKSKQIRRISSIPETRFRMLMLFTRQPTQFREMPLWNWSRAGTAPPPIEFVKPISDLSWIIVREGGGFFWCKWVILCSSRGANIGKEPYLTTYQGGDPPKYWKKQNTVEQHPEITILFYFNFPNCKNSQKTASDWKSGGVEPPPPLQQSCCG